MFFRLSSVVLVFALVVLGTPVKRDAKKVQSDIDKIVTQVKALDSKIKAIPGSGATYADALNLHNAVVDLSDTIKGATNDADASLAFTEEESLKIVGLAKTYAPLVQETCNDIEAKKAALQPLRVDSMIDYDLKTLKEDTDDFGEAIEAKVTEDQRAEVQELLGEADTALTKAINTYQG